jgi:mannosyltransferase OCH1-like enzyme
MLNKLKTEIKIETTKYSKPFILKQKYNPIMPLNIYQTWHTKNLPKKMFENIYKIKSIHPNFQYFLFDDNDCRNFIKKYFNNEVLWAFDKLKPGAFKADLWRYCILYEKGGIYLDIKFKCINNFNLIALTEKDHFVHDINQTGIYNALISSKAKNPILLECINKIVENVKNNYYGESMLHPTGPMLMENFFDSKKKSDIELKLETVDLNGLHQHLINYNGNYILCIYDNYRNDQKKYQKNEHYSILWNNKNIYNL